MNFVDRQNLPFACASKNANCKMQAGFGPLRPSSWKQGEHAQHPGGGTAYLSCWKVGSTAPVPGRELKRFGESVWGRGYTT